MANLPDCWCGPLNDCNWKISANINYAHADPEVGLTESIDWNLTGIPHALAKAIMAAQTAVMNEKGAEIFTDMLVACHGDEGEAAAATVRKLVGGVR